MQKIGDWSNGMIGVSKTFGGSSILSSPADKKLRSVVLLHFWAFFDDKSSEYFMKKLYTSRKLRFII